jgi:hypothetical protein
MNLSRTRSVRLMEKHCFIGFWLAVQLCIAAYPLGSASSASGRVQAIDCTRLEGFRSLDQQTVPGPATTSLTETVGTSRS